MSANNYYGFTHTGTQYGNTYTPVANTGYTMAAALQYNTGNGGVQRTASYDQSYATQSAPSTYTYGRTVATSGGVGYGAVDGSQYQTGANSSVAANANNPYPYNSSTYTNTYNSVVSNYAATALYNQQATPGTDDTTSTAIYSSAKTSNWNFKKSLKGSKPKTNTKVQQLHYCDVCKISCAGPQTYKEHLEGQRHKKKEVQLKSGTTQVNPKRHVSGIGGISLRCELCDVTCTGNDAYAAHIRGAKHQKVVKLHTKLGKPIPSTDPTVVSPNVNKSVTSKIQATAAAAVSQTSTGKIKVLGTPRINFIGGGRLHTTSLGELKEESTASEVTINVAPAQPQTQQPITVNEATNSQMIDLDKCDALPVGQDYIDEIKSDEGKVVSFHCKLCDCRFNDPNAKEMHLKGRRHRLQYKKKVDPNLVVDVKPSLKHRKQIDVKDRRFNYKRDMHYWNDWYPPNSGRYYEARHIPPLIPPPPPPHMAPPPPPGFNLAFIGNSIPHYRRGTHSGSWDDIHIMQKHSEICPKEEELDDIHHLVSCVERALKLVSDKIAEVDAELAMNDIIKREFANISESFVKDTNNDTNSEKDNQQTSSQTENEAKADDSQHFRLLKGLMRVGALAKGLLLTGDRDVNLVVICAEKPTKELLQRIVDYLPSQLQAVSASESFEIVMKPYEAGLSVSSTNDPKVTANVLLTSPLVRDENVGETANAEMVKEPKQLLDRQKCLSALAALRHTKWFQARVANLQPCSIVIRLLRDLCKRLPTWSKLNLWAVELLCEKVIASAGEPLSPGEALRHTFEAIASGLLLPGGTGLLDPCEKDPTDALSSLTRQEREDITSSAQHALRLIAFRQVYKILGVDPLPQRNRKRRLDSENGTSIDTDLDIKKDKKDLQDNSNVKNGSNVKTETIN